VFLKSNVTLWLGGGATLVGGSNMRDFQAAIQQAEG